MDMDLVQQDVEEDKEDRGGSVVNKRQLADRAGFGQATHLLKFADLQIFAALRVLVLQVLI